MGRTRWLDHMRDFFWCAFKLLVRTVCPLIAGLLASALGPAGRLDLLEDLGVVVVVLDQLVLTN